MQDNQQYFMDTFLLMGSVSIGRPRNTKAIKPTDRKSLAMKANARRAKAKRDGEHLLKDTENRDLDDPLYQMLLRRNKAIQTHLIAFCTLARFALSNNWRICYGEYRKRIPLKDMEKEHTALTRWLKKNTSESLTAVSFGVGKKGYVYIYFLSTNEHELQVHDLAISFAHYLRHKRNYIPIELKPYEKDPMKFIESKYCDDSIQTLDEIFTKLDIELFHVLRASFALPFKHRTLKTEAAEALLLALSEPVSFDHVYFDYGQKDILDKAHSVFIGSTGNESYEALNVNKA